MSQETLSRAWEVLQDAYQAQMEGDYERAVELYQSSLDLYPTAEAHTFLGWTYHFQGRLNDAITECKRAIEIDPEFGNPYNDIAGPLRRGHPMAGTRSRSNALRAAPFSALQPGPRLSGQRDVRESYRLLPAGSGHRTTLRASPRSSGFAPPPGQLGRSVSRQIAS